jgi:hypothetical protein
MGKLIIMALGMGLGATALLDLWAMALNRIFGFPLPNWALVGRWVLHLPKGQYLHENIADAEPFPNELAVGWLFHYAVGIAFAVAVLLIGGMAWANAPTWPIPMLVGLVTVGAGWFILQPGMGAGIAASRRPDATRVRILNVLGHIVFGLGLWWSALLLT